MIDKWEKANTSFYEYICHVEAIFVVNFTADQMIAFTAGNLMRTISTAILNHPEMRLKFENLCPDKFKVAYIYFEEVQIHT